MTIDEMIAIKKKYGYSYEYISLKSGVPASTVQKVLTKKTPSPRYQTLAALSNAFQYTELSPGQYSSHKEEKAALIRDHSASYYAVSGTSTLRRKSNTAKTITDYLALPEGSRTELIDGEFYDLASPGSLHQIICTRLWEAFASYIDSNEGACVPLVAPMDVQLDCDDQTMVQPDVLVVCDREKIREDRIVGAPDFIVEILSPSTWYHDTIRKLLKYKKAGVREYWIVMPHNQRVLTYWFQESDLPVEYDFHDTVPVQIWGEKCKVDFQKVYDKISFLLQQMDS